MHYIRGGKLCKKDILASLYQVAVHHHRTSDRGLPEWKVKYVMKAKGYQRPLHNTENQGSQISGSCHQPSEGKNCILNRRPYKIEQDPDKYIDKCGNNRHKPGTAEKGKSIGKQNLMEPVMKGRYPQTHDNSPKHTHLKCLYSAHAGNGTFQHIRGDASVRKYFPRDLQYCTD